ncbi:MAG TPA: serine protease [Ornithinibacter sp.]|nr:serine protease [Ornithinibacter sp.]
MVTEAGEQVAGAPERDPADGPTGWRRLLPTTALGIAVALFCASVASAFTGAVLYAFYEYRLGQTEDRVDAFEAEFEDEVDAAVAEIQEQRDDAVGQVQSQLDDLERFAASGETLQGLLESASPSVWFVETRDDAGQPSVGSAFVAFADSEQSFLVTSYDAVRANTQEPVPGIEVVKGDERLAATLVRWDEARDLALLSIDKPGLPALPWVAADPPPQVGDRVFVVSGLGGGGGAVSQGFIAGVSAQGVQHDAPVGAAFRGGPLVNSGGEVLAIASRAYSPLGFAPEAVFFGVPIRGACESLLSCPEGAQPG